MDDLATSASRLNLLTNVWFLAEKSDKESEIITLSRNCVHSSSILPMAIFRFNRRLPLIG
jgi:hypothetical protein